MDAPVSNGCISISQPLPFQILLFDVLHSGYLGFHSTFHHYHTVIAVSVFTFLFDARLQKESRVLK